MKSKIFCKAKKIMNALMSNRLEMSLGNRKIDINMEFASTSDKDFLSTTNLYITRDVRVQILIWFQTFFALLKTTFSDF